MLVWHGMCFSVLGMSATARHIMKSKNFEFLRTTWPEPAELGGFAEAYARSGTPRALKVP
jgi:hypothetical protein